MHADANGLFILLTIACSSRQLETWSATARSVPPEDPLFWSIKTLLDTTGEGRNTEFAL
jgi:hypothetical protein